MSWRACCKCDTLFRARKGYGGRILCEGCLKHWPGEIEITKKNAIAAKKAGALV